MYCDNERGILVLRLSEVTVTFRWSLAAFLGDQQRLVELGRTAKPCFYLSSTISSGTTLGEKETQIHQFHHDTTQPEGR